MAKEKQDWKDVIRSKKQERDRQDDRIDPRQQKKLATLHYKRRKLDKDVKNYIEKNEKTLKGGDIEAIGRKHGFFVS